jgi:nitrogen-specific signal transduction histidine kinase
VNGVTTRTQPHFADWAAIADSLIGGIAHALSNRIATLAALGELMRLDDDAAEGATMLRQETGRLEALVHSLRLLGNETDTSAEPLELGEILEQSVALHRYHRDLRDVEVDIDTSARVMPVRIERRRATHALLMMLAATAAVATVRQQVVRVQLTGDAASVRLTLAVPGNGLEAGAPSEALLDAARALIEASGGVISSDSGSVVLELPALGALRERERTAR